MKIVVVNQYTNNFGDDIAGSAVLEELVRRFPNANIEVFYSFNLSQARLPFTHPRVTHHNQSSLWSKSLKSLMIDYYFKGVGYLKLISDSLIDADVVLVSPSGAAIGIYRDWRFLVCICLCVNHGKQVVFHLNTIGSSRSSLFNFVARLALKRCHVFVREWKSHQYLKELGISSELGVDSALLSPRIHSPFSQKTRVITFIPTRLSGWHPHFKSFNDEAFMSDIIQDIADGANRFQLSIRLLPHVWGGMSEQEYISSLADRIREKVAAQLDVSIVNPQTAYDYDRVIADSYLVVSMRYHGCILAIKNAVPFVALSYENKMKEACLYANAIEDYLDVKEYRSQQLASLINRSIKSYASIVSALDARYMALHRMAHKPIDFLEAFLTSEARTSTSTDAPQ